MEEMNALGQLPGQPVLFFDESVVKKLSTINDGTALPVSINNKYG